MMNLTRPSEHNSRSVSVDIAAEKKILEEIKQEGDMKKDPIEKKEMRKNMSG